MVQPFGLNCVPGKHLEEHGEDFFLIAYQVEDAERAAKTVIARNGSVLNTTPRRGLEDWKLIDIDCTETMGVPSQLVESNKS